MTGSSADRDPRVGCGAAIVRDGRLLLIQRRLAPEAGAWSLPGGKIDLYETVQAAVEREVLEELGLVIKAEDLLCVMNHIDRDADIHWVAPVYLVTEHQGVPRLCEPGKHAALGWFELNALPSPLARSVVVAAEAMRARSDKIALAMPQRYFPLG
ncbi:MAG: NUDIX domain-containing protein [Caulobacteraceae bacterium]|nr:NUDIX domain-containing protein [Caulobacteraceae bacterium]